jgi:hypothetical protein
MMGEACIFLEMAEFQKNTIDLSKWWKSKFDGLNWLPFLTMKTWSYHSWPIDQNLALLF